MYRSIYAYPWELQEGLDAALARIREAGLNTITLAANCGAGGFMPSHGGAGAVAPATEGAVCFRARAERYGHIRPRVHPMVEEFDALAELQRAAPDLRRAAWVLCCRNRSLGEQHPEFVSRNALGDPYPDSLCPAHPAVRDYVVNLCADLAHGYDLAGVVLETPGWLPYDHVHHLAGPSTPLDGWAKMLLTVCFAETTRHAARAASIDADRLQVQAREALERYFAAGAVSETGAAERSLADLVSDPGWAAFLHWRCRQVADLVTNVRAALPAGTALAVMPTVQRRAADCWLEGSDPAMLAVAADALEIPVCQGSAEALSIDAGDLRRRAGADAALHFVARPDGPGRAHGADVIDAALTLKRIGMAGIAFCEHGKVRPASLDRIKEVLAALDAS